MALHALQHGHLDDDEDGDVCRICRSGGERLYHPCKCAGSIKFVHAACLTQWLQHSGNTHCEVSSVVSM